MLKLQYVFGRLYYTKDQIHPAIAFVTIIPDLRYIVQIWIRGDHLFRGGLYLLYSARGSLVVTIILIWLYSMSIANKGSMGMAYRWKIFIYNIRIIIKNSVTNYPILPLTPIIAYNMLSIFIPETCKRLRSGYYL